MLSPSNKNKIQSPRALNSKLTNAVGSSFAPHPHHHLSGFKAKTMTEMKSQSPKSKGSNSPFEKHERSFTTLYGKYMKHKSYTDNHELGYSAEQIKKAVSFIFQKYDSNHDDFLDREEVNKLIQHSLLHMGQKHTPSQLEIVEFIYSMDKNNDGRLSRDQLENAFKRANRIQY